METFSTIVSICSGVSVIIALVLTLVRPIRERITRVKERDKQIQDRFNELKADIDGVSEKVIDIDEKVERYEAQRARTQILRFSDEMYEGTKHSREHFECILEEAIPAYNQYCEAHPKFKNDQTIIAQERIRKVYAKCLEEHSFLHSRKEDQHEDK